MILKKPYAFIIKHFRIINIILLIPILYITLTFKDIASFYTRFVESNYINFERGISGKYITLWLLVTIVIMILVNIILFMLMKKKKKKTLFYGLSIVYFFILFMLSMIVYNNLTLIELGQANNTTTVLMKDLLFFAPFPGYFITVVTLFRGIGFNIKSLKFDKTLDLQITDEDNEEIEIGTNKENISYKKIIIHMFRELRYYIVENKFIFSCIALLFILVIFSNIYINVDQHNKKYSSNNLIALNGFIISVEDSYITNTDQGGNVLGKNKYFLAIRMKIENNSDQYVPLNRESLLIKVRDKKLFPSYDMSSNFEDIGKKYLGTNIPPKSQMPKITKIYSCPKGYNQIKEFCYKGKEKVEAEIKEEESCPTEYNLIDGRCDIKEEQTKYVIVYELEEEDIRSSYELKLLNKTRNKIGDLSPSFVLIKFRPKNILNRENALTTTLGMKIDFSKTLLKETTLTVKKIEYTGSYQYNYKYCDKSNNCYDKKDVVIAGISKKLIIIDDFIDYDKTSSYYINTKRKFYEDFGKIRFDINGKTLNEKVKDVTPTQLKTKKIYEVSNVIDRGENKKLVLKIRNQEFVINLGE